MNFLALTFCEGANLLRAMMPLIGQASFSSDDQETNLYFGWSSDC